MAGRRSQRGGSTDPSSLCDLRPAICDPEVAGPGGCGVESTSCTGLKYLATTDLALSLAEISHNTRNSAIMAVMKSAKAIFQAPP